MWMMRIAIISLPESAWMVWNTFVRASEPVAKGSGIANRPQTMFLICVGYAPGSFRGEDVTISQPDRGIMRMSA